MVGCHSCDRRPLALVAWYEFRPERLVFNQTVDEVLPGSGRLSTDPRIVDLPQCLASDRWYGNGLSPWGWPPHFSFLTLYGKNSKKLSLADGTFVTTKKLE